MVTREIDLLKLSIESNIHFHIERHKHHDFGKRTDATADSQLQAHRHAPDERVKIISKPLPKMVLRRAILSKRLSW